MPKPLVTFIDAKNLYVCKKCETHLVALNQLVSKSFRGRSGNAYLFNKVENVKQSQQRDQNMLSGLHRVVNLFCAVCDNDKAIGWKYIKAYEESQKYKEGRYILERFYIKKENWDDEEEDKQSDC